MTLPKTPGRITPSFAFSYVNRSIQEGLGRRQFTTQDHFKVVGFFGGPNGEPSCAYCGAPEPRRWDHVVPVTLGGETVLGNMVLACNRCDDSKRHTPFDTWLQGQGVTDADARILRINEYMRKFGYSNRNLRAALSTDDLRVLDGLLSEANSLKVRITAFLSMKRF